MPALLVSELEAPDKLPMVEIPYAIHDKYPFVFTALDEGYKVDVRVYLSRFFNRNDNVVKEYKRLFLLSVRKKYTGYYIDLTYFHVKEGIPVGYFVELLIIGFITTLKDGKTIETPVFPNEFIVLKGLGVPNKISDLVDAEKEALERVGKDVEVIGLLYTVGLTDVAADLVEALTRFYMSDYEGSIKFFRKVVEGIRGYVRENEVPGMSDNRQELLKGCPSRAYQLVSNFGEHAGTYGFMPEATLSKDIAVAFCRYLISYIGVG